MAPGAPFRLQLGLELPALPRWDPTGRVPDGAGGIYPKLARTAELAGFDVLWCTRASAPGAGGLEPCTLAGGLSPHTSRLLLGARVRIARDRHPAVLARDVTTLDVLSGGRAALLLEGEPGPPGQAPGADDGLPARVAHLVEAVSVCRALFAEEAATLAGRFFRVAAAVNRPPPLAPGGPPVVADLSSVMAPSGGQVTPEQIGRSLDLALSGGLGAAGALVLGEGLEQLDALRRMLASASASASAGGGGPEHRPRLLWRGVPPAGPSEATRWAGRIFSVGIDGILCRLAGDGLPSVRWVAALGAALAAARPM